MCKQQIMNMHQRETDQLETARLVTSLHRGLFQHQQKWIQRTTAQNTRSLRRNTNI